MSPLIEHKMAAHATKQHIPSTSRDQGGLTLDQRLCNRRAKSCERFTIPCPIITGDLAKPEVDEKCTSILSEESRPMFSPVPMETTVDGDYHESPQLVSRLVRCCLDVAMFRLLQTTSTNTHFDVVRGMHKKC